MRRTLCLLLLLLTAPPLWSDDLQPPTFSHLHGIYRDAFALTLGHPNPQADIRYTTDGSIPTSASRVFQVPLSLSETTVIRAVAMLGDSLSDVVTSTYIFPQSFLTQSATPEGFPAIWGPFVTIHGYAPADYEMDPELLSDPLFSACTLEGLYQLPILSLVGNRDDFFAPEPTSHSNSPSSAGIYVDTDASNASLASISPERPISVEFFGGPQILDVQSDCGIRIHGGQSRIAEKTPKHNFRLKWRSLYGTDSLCYPLFGDTGPATFSTLVLKATFGNSWIHWDDTQRSRAQYQRDRWMRTMQAGMGQPCSRGLWVHLFIDGLYWGIYDVCERIDATFCAAHFGGDEADWDVIRVDDTPAGLLLEAPDGTLDAWNEMTRLASCASTQPSAWLRLQGLDCDGLPSDTLSPLLDVANFIDYMLLNQYAGNTDWDHHNWYAIRNRCSPDTGFRFLCWDSEMVLGGLRDNVVPPARSHRGPLWALFSDLMKNDEFRYLYADHVTRQCTDSGILTPEKVMTVWDSLSHCIDKALYAESARWGDYRRDVHPWMHQGALYTFDDTWQTEYLRLHDRYFPARTQVFLRQLRRRWCIRSDNS